MSAGARYAIVQPSMWADPEFRELPPGAQRIYLYLLTNPHADWSGIYHLSFATIADDLNLELADVQDALDGPLESLVEYDTRAREVFVVGAGRVQIGDEMKPDDKRRKPLERHLAGIHSKALLQRFYDVYGKPWHLSPDGASDGASDGAPHPPPEAHSHSHSQTESHIQAQGQGGTAAGLSTGTAERQRRSSGGEHSADDIARAAKAISKPGRVDYHVKLMEQDAELVEIAIGLRWLIDTGEEFERGEMFFDLDRLLETQPELRERCLNAYRKKLDAETPRTARLEAG